MIQCKSQHAKVILAEKNHPQNKQKKNLYLLSNLPYNFDDKKIHIMSVTHDKKKFELKKIVFYVC